MAYDYKKASDLYTKIKAYFDPWAMDSEEMQKDRRLFMRAYTRNDFEKIRPYISWLEEQKEILYDIESNENEKIYDFELVRDIDSIIEELEKINKPTTAAQKVVNDLTALNNKINEMLDNLGGNNFDDSINFNIEYNGVSVPLWFFPESVENMQMLIKNMINVINEDYI